MSCEAVSQGALRRRRPRHPPPRHPRPPAHLRRLPPLQRGNQGPAEGLRRALAAAGGRRGRAPAGPARLGERRRRRRARGRARRRGGQVDRRLGGAQGGGHGRGRRRGRRHRGGPRRARRHAAARRGRLLAGDPDAGSRGRGAVLRHLRRRKGGPPAGGEGARCRRRRRSGGEGRRRGHGRGRGPRRGDDGRRAIRARARRPPPMATAALPNTPRQGPRKVAPGRLRARPADRGGPPGRQAGQLPGTRAPPARQPSPSGTSRESGRRKGRLGLAAEERRDGPGRNRGAGRPCDAPACRRRHRRPGAGPEPLGAAPRRRNTRNPAVFWPIRPDGPDILRRAAFHAQTSNRAPPGATEAEETDEAPSEDRHGSGRSGPRRRTRDGPGGPAGGPRQPGQRPAATSPSRPRPRAPTPRCRKRRKPTA